MPDDASGSNDEELLSQIEQLRARMDRLMKGGTSTSNSALLTDPPKQAPQTVPSQPVSTPPPERARVGDLIGHVDKEILEGHAGQQEAVAFPDEDHSSSTHTTDRSSEDRPAPPAPSGRPRPASVDGSIISVGNGRSDSSRPRVTSFDDLGSAVEEELARDTSVPPLEPKRGPGLASRFGSADEPVSVRAEPVPEQITEDEFDEDGVEPELVTAEAEEDLVAVVGGPRSARGALFAIWGFTAVTSGTIAVLHFVGTI